MKTKHVDGRASVETAISQTGRKAFEVATRHTIHNDKLVDENTTFRRHYAPKPGKKDFPLHPDGAKVIYHFQIDPVEYRLFQRDYPDLYAAMKSSDRITRERANACVAKMNPHWVVTAPGMGKY